MTVTVLNDKGFALRSKFEEWSTKIQALQQNLQEAKVISQYQSDAVVRQYDRQGAVVRSYQFVGISAFLTSLPLTAWDSNDTPEEYTVEFQFSCIGHTQTMSTWQTASDKDAK